MGGSMRYEFHIDKLYTATVVMDFPEAEDELECDDMAGDWAAEHWEEVECELACVQYVDNNGNELTIWD